MNCVGVVGAGGDVDSVYGETTSAANKKLII